MGSSAKRVVIVGGGSNAWTPTIVKDMMLTPALAGSLFVLYDIDLPAARRAAAFLRRLSATLGAGSSFLATSDRGRAFDGADYFVVTISTGGLAAMAHDLALPERYGIWHTVGDTAGPGGWARSVRNAPVFMDLARDFNRYAPRAPVLNYTNPLTVLTTILSRLCSAPVVGLCHGLFENLEFLALHHGLEDEAELSASYAGVNHFFWTTAVSVKGKDVLPALFREVKRRGFTELQRDLEPDPASFDDHRDLATALYLETGVLPYLGDRHTCEFLSWCITDRTVMERYHLKRTSIAARRAGWRTRERALAGMTVGEIPGEYKTRSRETAADIIAAHATGRAFIDVGNVPNIGQVSNLPKGAVVETAVRVDSNGFSPICFGDLPAPVLGLVEPAVQVFEATARACLEHDREAALRALRLDPSCAHLDSSAVRGLGERLLEAHRAWTGPLFGAAGRRPGPRRVATPARRQQKRAQRKRPS